jgi:hypothetical protein
LLGIVSGCGLVDVRRLNERITKAAWIRELHIIDEDDQDVRLFAFESSAEADSRLTRIERRERMTRAYCFIVIRLAFL